MKKLTILTFTSVALLLAASAMAQVATRVHDLTATGNATITGNTTGSGAVLLGSATGGMPSAGVVNAKGFKIDGVDVSTSSDTYWVADAPGIKYVAGPMSLNGTPTGDAGDLQAEDVTAATLTAPTGTALTLTGGDSGASLSLGAGATKPVTLTTGSGHFVVSGGNVGIGETSPSQILHIKATSPNLLIERAGTSNEATLKLNTGATNNWEIGMGLASIGSDLDFYNFVLAANVARFTSTGNLLIGTTTDSLTGAGGLAVASTTAATSSAGALRISNTGGSHTNIGGGAIWTSGNITAGTGASDTRMITKTSTAYALGVQQGSANNPFYIGASASATPSLILSNTNGDARFTLTDAGNATFAGDLTVSGTSLAVGAPGANTGLTFGGTPSGNNSGTIKFQNSNTVTNWMLASNQNVAGVFELTPSTTAGGTTFTTPALKAATTGVSFIGTTTNDNAATGYVGEYVSSTVASGSAVSLTTATPANVTSISLTAGDWDVRGVLGFVLNAATTVAYLGGSSSSTSATLGGLGTEAYFPGSGATLSTGPQIALPVVRFSLSSTTTVYLVAQASFGVNTASAFGAINARRVR